MELHALNSVTGTEGLCPRLCVFGAIPRPLRTDFAQSQLDRAKAIDIAMKEVQKYHERKMVSLGLK